MSAIAQRLSEIQARIARAAERAGRSPGDIQLVAISKTRTVPEIVEAIHAGVQIIGENRVQEAAQKRPHIALPVHWHLVGHLQRNKVKKAIDLFDLIHSLDSLPLAEALDRRALERGSPVEVLVQVNTSGEPSKFGIAPCDALHFIEQMAHRKGIVVRGLMTIGLFEADMDKVRPCFERLRRLKEEVEAQGIPTIRMDVLSMGMTNDFEVAIEEGATMVRIGTAIFGPRSDEHSAGKEVRCSTSATSLVAS